MRQRVAPEGWVAGRFQISETTGLSWRDGWFHPELGVGMSQPAQRDLIALTELASGRLIGRVPADLFDLAYVLPSLSSQLEEIFKAAAEQRLLQEDVWALEEELARAARGYRSRAWRAW